MRKKLFWGGILVIILNFAIVAVFGSNISLPFIDVKESAWYYDEVKTAYDEGIMQGKSSDTFDPEAQTKRAEFVKVLCAISGDNYIGKGASLTFVDIEAGAWYMDYVGWGVEHDIVKGLLDNKFGPDQPVTRQEMAVFIDRFVKYLDKDLPNDPQIDSFKDAGEVESWATESVELMRVSGIITGDESGYFKPQDNASRAEIATVITRLLPIIKDSNDNTDEPPVIKPPVIDRENFNVQEAFMYGDKNENIAFPYRIYVPEDYSANKEYPLLVYLHNRSVAGTDNVRPLNDASILFNNPNSPAFDSIVIVPQSPTAWPIGTSDSLAKLIDYINDKYSIDSERQYIVGAWQGCFAAWQMIRDCPSKVSAALFIHGTGPTFGSDGKGNILGLLDEMPNDSLNIPIHFLHDTDDGVKTEWVLGPDYGRMAYDTLTKIEGFTNVYLTETSGYGANVYKHFVSTEDITLLEWLFEQRRETK